MKIIPLGTNGFFPSFNRQTACYAIPYGKILIILDAGSGLFRFAEPIGRKLLNGVNEIHIYLSHYHLDHTFGFYGAFKLFKDKKVTVYADTGKQVFWEFVVLKHFPVDYQKVHRNFNWQILSIGDNRISDYKVRVRKQDHRGEGSLAFRFGFKNNEFSYVTDSEVTKEGIEFVRNVPVLLHEHDSFGSQKELYNGTHVTTFGTTSIARKAKTGKLFLIHHSPFADDDRLNMQLKAARPFFPSTYLASDKKEIPF